MFTNLSMIYYDAFDRLTEKEVITPIGLTEDSSADKRSKSWNKDAYCKFHPGNEHDIEDCYKLKHLIQNMVDNRLYHSLLERNNHRKFCPSPKIMEKKGRFPLQSYLHSPQTCIQVVRLQFLQPEASIHRLKGSKTHGHSRL